MSEGAGSGAIMRPKLAELQQKASQKKSLRDGRRRVKKPRRAELAALISRGLSPALVLDSDGFVLFASESALGQLELTSKDLIGHSFEPPAGWQRQTIEWRDGDCSLWLKASSGDSEQELQARCAKLEEQAERASKASDRLIEKMEKMVDKSAREARTVKKQLVLINDEAAEAKDRALQAERQSAASTRELDELNRQLQAERRLRARSEEELHKLKATSSHSTGRLEQAEERASSARRAADQAKARAQASETKLRLAQERIAELEALVHKHIPNQEDALLTLLKSKRSRGY